METVCKVSDERKKTMRENEFVKRTELQELVSP